MVSKALLVARGSGAHDDRANGGDGDGRLPWGPLACMPVANQSLLANAIEALAEDGVTDVAIVAEHGTLTAVEAIVAQLPAARRNGNGKPAVQISVLEQLPEGGLGSALELARPVLGEDAYVLHLGEALCWGLGEVVNGDEPKADDAIVFVQGPGGPTASAITRVAADGIAKVAPRRSRFGDLGVYMVGPAFADAVAAIEASGGIEAQARAALAHVGERGGQVSHRRRPGSWHYTASADNVLEANRTALDRLAPLRVGRGVTDTDIEGIVAIDPTAVVESCRIRGPVKIGPGARIVDSYIGPFTTIAGGAEIEGAEIEYSVILDGVSVRHLGTRLEASVIGPNAQVFRDFRLPRALRLDVGPGARVSLA